MNNFETRLEKDCGSRLNGLEIKVIQVNVGLKCNQTCKHCHLQCGPERAEVMDWETMREVIRVAKDVQPELVDITGGSPELNPHFRKFIRALRQDGHTVQVRTNLTALHEQGMEGLPEFFKTNEIHIVASMPCYLEENVKAQRGTGVYEKSVQMLRKLNALGYGKETELPLFLVYNPGGPFLPPDQAQLESDYKRELFQRFGIEFSHLYTIANMPIGRFWEDLKRQKKDDEYMELLLNGFNCQTVEDLMCRHQICVAWDGTLFDCDFNIALDMPVDKGLPRYIRDFDPRKLKNRKIVTGQHCFGCTAGFGSSCGGALLSDSPEEKGASLS
ncbi:MAG: arsenosugar biosynthesis radical SAM protein ArsS [Candidatus Aminicenantes bacterium]|jgi:radical SAM/Cys-rich protein